MLLQSLELNNIRSYVDERIVFPSGSFLLSGDIGSGKSTILLGIEFALFGLLRGEISGSSLLRHGADKGFVALEFSIQDAKYRIGRFLKRSTIGISQEAGFIITDGVQEDLSASELKVRVLTLLGYPLALASKGKNSLFRYTVYTPQEDMKKILLDSSDERVEVLRRVFLIEKYKVIQENVRLYSRILRERCKILEGVARGLDEKKSLLLEKESKFEVLLSEIVGSEILLQAKSDRSSLLRKNLDVLSLSVDSFRDSSRALDAERSKISSLNSSLDRCKKRLLDIGDISSDIQEKLDSLVVQELDFSKELDRLNGVVLDCSRLKSSLHAKIEGVDDLSRRISSLDVCPVCLQKVPGEHKHSFGSEQSAKRLSLSTSFDKVSQEEIVARESMLKTRALLDSVRKSIGDCRVLVSRSGERSRLVSEIEVVSKDISLSDARCKSLESFVAKNSSIIEDFSKAKSAVDVALRDERDVLARLTSLRREAEISKETIHMLRKDVVEKEFAVKNLNDLSLLSSWFSDSFSVMVSNIEKQVLARVYHSLNDFFREWFSLLVSDDSLSVRLDDSFSPVIVQNGFDSSFDSLSGGERTACALAYRLALNRVVGDVVSSLRTGGLLILDEPTDGFSDAQLDSLRDVLSSLNLKQVCIVSHELKIGSFVENVVHVKKENSTSRIVSGV